MKIINKTILKIGQKLLVLLIKNYLLNYIIQTLLNIMKQMV